MWSAGFPEAVLPLWQLAQVLSATVLWSNLADVQALVRWQESQPAVVGMCEAEAAVASGNPLPPAWQPLQVFGVPFRMPR